MFPSVPLSKDIEIELTPSDELFEVINICHHVNLLLENRGHTLFSSNGISILNFHRWWSNVGKVFNGKNRDRNQFNYQQAADRAENRLSDKYIVSGHLSSSVRLSRAL